jgi:hypothetical protein
MATATRCDGVPDADEQLYVPAKETPWYSSAQ